MKTLILDTSSDLLYVSILESEKQVFVKTLLGHNVHSENLLNVINEGLNATSTQMDQLSKVIVGVGPGSYTGLRVALVIAKTFCWTLNIPLYTISSLDLLASGYYKIDGTYAIVNIAKKNFYYGKVVEVKGTSVNVLIDDEFISFDDFAKQIEKFDNIKIITISDYAQDSSVILKRAKKVEAIDLHSLVPNYLRVANS